MMDQAQNLREMMNKSTGSATRVITITSGKGGVGKSSFALNMAIELSKRGKKVLLIDTDFGFANIDVMLGVTTRYNLLHAINGQKEVHEIIEQGVEGVHFVSGGSGLYDLVKMNSFQLNRIIHSFRRLETIADTIIFDTGAGVNDNILRLIHASHETIVVTTPEPTAIMDAYSLIKIACSRKEKPRIRLVVNKAESEKEANAALNGLVRIAEKYIDTKLEKLGYILRDDNMIKAVKMQVPLVVSFPNSSSARNISQLMDVFLDEKEQGSQKLGLADFLRRITGSN